MKYALSLVALFFFFPSARAIDAGYSATYELAVGPLTVGKMERRFEIDTDGRYHFISNIEATGLASFFSKDKLRESSLGNFRDGEFYPDEYRYQRDNKRKPRSVFTTFDRGNATIETVYNDKPMSSPLKAKMLDKLVYQAALMEDLAAGKTQLNYLVTDRGKEKTYAPIAGANESIDTPAGTYNTVKVVRERPDSQKRSIFWCAPTLDYLPVRVAHREKNGNETIVTLTRYEALGLEHDSTHAE